MIKQYLEAGDGITPAMVAKAIAEYQSVYQDNIVRLEKAYAYNKTKAGAFTSRDKDILYSALGLTCRMERLKFPFAFYISTVKVNYILGRPVQYGVYVEDKNDADIDIAELEDAITKIKRIYRAQSKSMTDKEIALQRSKIGFAYELVYVDKDDVQPHSCMLPAYTTCVVFDYSPNPKSLYAVHWYEAGGKKDERYKYRIHLYTEKYEYVYAAGSLINSDDWVELEDIRAQHYLGRVPVTLIKNNDSLIGDYELVLPLIEAVQDMSTGEQFSIQQNIDNILVFYNSRISQLKPEEQVAFKRMLNDLKILTIEQNEEDSGLTTDVKPLSNPLNVSNTELFLDRLWKAIFKLSGVPDPTQTEFYTQTSGVAIRLQMFVGLEPFAVNGEDSFAFALRRRFKMYNRILALRSQTKQVDAGLVDIRFTHNIPQNDLETAQIISNMYGKGIVSNETLSKQLSFVSDAAKEIEQANKDASKAAATDIMSRLAEARGETTHTDNN